MPKPKAFKVGCAVQMGLDTRVKMTVTRLFLKDENLEEVEVAYFNQYDELKRETLPKEALKVI